MIFVMPIIQLLILPLAADYEIKNINISIIDQDRSSFSRHLTEKIVSSGYFKLIDHSESYTSALEQIENNTADLILEIPGDFERSLVRENNTDLLIAVNAINGVKANLGGAYLGQIIQNFNSDIRMEYVSTQSNATIPIIEITSSYWFNTYLKYNIFMVPGILAILVTMVGAYMCSLNIVKEKEMGTIEQINVTPIKKHIFILGKLLPFWIIGIVIFTIGLFLVARLVYGIIPQGSLLMLYGFMMLYLIALLGFGLLVSTYADTQQQAMSVVFFFIVIFLLMSGLFTPIESMPEWSQVIARATPITYFIEVMRMVVLKGSGLRDILPHVGITFGFAVLFNGWAVWNYRKVI